MALRTFGKRKAELDNTGFSNKAENNTSRIINKDGTFNVKKRGMPFIERFSIYHYVLDISNFKFSMLVFGFYTLVNLLFACVYMVIGFKHLNGIISDGTFWGTFEEMFFFSSQTLTTVGYGRISPVGFLANLISSIEALIGIMTLAIITGLLYGRFVKPKAFIRYSKNAIIRPFKEATALMLRFAAVKNNQISQLKASVNVFIQLEENGEKVNKFYDLPLEINFINTLFATWTLVHIINEESPLYLLTADDFEKGRIQINVNLHGFDEGFSNTVLSRSSYVHDEIIFNKQFEKMTDLSYNQEFVIIDLKKLDGLEPLDIPK